MLRSLKIDIVDTVLTNGIRWLRTLAASSICIGIFITAVLGSTGWPIPVDISGAIRLGIAAAAVWFGGVLSVGGWVLAMLSWGRTFANMFLMLGQRHHGLFGIRFEFLTPFYGFRRQDLTDLGLEYRARAVDGLFGFCLGMLMALCGYVSINALSFVLNDS